eukprot:TRINITY_DN31091_c0_g1_i1.p1 TRINITY_DN31091_c0_g1~~TRINITY_DN31091_c0_g1_i1.p1  ORF type:complete len:489 (+),score=37.67 TRINITY_DN31091_c0_g1_i1:100-1566(+)
MASPASVPSQSSKSPVPPSNIIIGRSQVCPAPLTSVPCSLRADGDLVSFHAICAGPDDSNQQWVKIRSGRQPAVRKRFATEAIRFLSALIILYILLLSLTYMLFKVVLRVPGDDFDPSEDEIGDWIQCGLNSTGLPTRLGEKLSYDRVRQILYGTQVVTVAIYGLLMLGLLEPSRPRFLASSTVACFMALAGLAYLHLNPDAPPELIALWLLLQLVCPIVFGSGLIRGRPWVGKIFQSCAPLLFGLTTLLLVVCVDAMMVLMENIELLPIPPLAVMAILVLVIRGSGLLARGSFRKLVVPSRFSFATLFAFDACCMLILRRYMLYFEDHGKIVLMAVSNAAMEMLINAASTGYMIHMCDQVATDGDMERVHVVANLYFSGVVSELLAEHFALGCSLGYSLFLDPRILTIAVKYDLTVALRNWGICVLCELLSDIVTCIFVVWHLPVSFKGIYDAAYSLVAMMNLVNICILGATLGLHTSLDKGRYLCA